MNKLILRKNRIRQHHYFRNILLTIIIIIIFSFIFIKIIGKNIRPYYINYAQAEIKRIITVIINDNVINNMVEQLQVEELFNITKNSKGEIQLIDFNSKEVIKLVSFITNHIEQDLTNLSLGKIDNLNIDATKFNLEQLKQGIICKISLGAASNNSLLANLGPKVPVKLNIIGDVLGNINTTIYEYGINAAKLEVLLEIAVNARIVLPLTNEVMTVTSRIPIATKIIHGAIPNYYYGGITSSSPLVTS